MHNDFQRVVGDVEAAIGYADLHGALRDLVPWLARIGTLEPADRERALALLGRALSIGYGERFDAVTRAAAGAPDEVDPLLALGYELVEHGVLEPAAAVLRRAVALSPTDPRPLHELVAALERQGRYGAALAALRAAPPGVAAHPLTRYLVAFHAALVGDPGPAQATAAHLARHSAPRYAFMGRRLQALRARAEAASGLDASPDQRRELWVSGTVLLDRAPASPESAGPLASTEGVAGLVAALRAALEAQGASRPRALALPDRDSQVVGHAVARALGVPLETWYTGARPGLLVAWELAGALAEQLAELKRRIPGQLLFAVVADPDAEDPIAADLLGALASRRAPPWGGGGATLDFRFDLDDDEPLGETTAEDDPREPEAIGGDVARLAAEAAPPAAAREVIAGLARASLAGDEPDERRHRRWRRPTEG